MGARTFVYPKETGLPIGGREYNPYVMLEIHYNNPNLLSDVHDSSGVKLTITKRLRPEDAGVIELGLVYTDKLAIPWGQVKFIFFGKKPLASLF